MTGGSPLTDSLLAVVAAACRYYSPTHNSQTAGDRLLKKLLHHRFLNETNPNRSSLPGTVEDLLTYLLIARLYLRRQPWQLSQFPWFTTLQHTAPKFYKLSGEQLSALQRQADWSFRGLLVLKEAHRSRFLIHLETYSTLKKAQEMKKATPFHFSTVIPLNILQSGAPTKMTT